ncbi:hypothetical protein EEJ42_08905 [Streptomyces botrytidirepellens]|uniref:Uncharacterized protein n=1 Tax=Streptomyces botrytidirepellens TaxID=2486417 RepID=A0A3M8WQR9_9ACTN|nr:hypothetical protein EEJ42_08905 [Streptomyces botrytidirepellens]
MVRLTVVLLLTAAWWLLPGLLRLDGRLPGGGAWEAAAALVVLFAWVGAEGDVPAMPRLGPRTVWRLLYGPVTAAALLALVLDAPQPGPDASQAAGAAGVAAAVVLTAYCVTNLAACGARWSQLRLHEGSSGVIVPAATSAKGPVRTPGTAARGGIWAAAAVAATVLTLARIAHMPTVVLLLGPGTATASLLVLSAAAALRPVRRQDADEAPPEPTPTTRSVPDTESYDRSPTP